MAEFWFTIVASCAQDAIIVNQNLAMLGNVLVRMQRVHEPIDLWDFLHLQILRLLVLFKPADFEAQGSQVQTAPTDPNSCMCNAG